MNNKHFLELNKKAFTLIEVLVSVSILVLVFSFIYSQFNFAQKSTKKTTQIEYNVDKRWKILSLIYNDFISSQKVEPTSGNNYDKFVKSFNTKNSLYGISNPFVKYVVVEDDDVRSLIRLESNSSEIRLSESVNKFYMDEIVKDIEFFKVIVNNEYIEIFIKAKDMKDIYFRFKKII